MFPNKSRPEIVTFISLLQPEMYLFDPEITSLTNTLIRNDQNRFKKTLHKYIIQANKIKITNYGKEEEKHLSLVARVLGDGLRALGDGVLGELPGEDETDGGLDLTRGEGVLLVVAGETSGLRSDALEDVVGERVHDAHGLRADAGAGVNLLEDLVDVDPVRLLPPGLALLGATFLASLRGLAVGSLSDLGGGVLGDSGRDRSLGHI